MNRVPESLWTIINGKAFTVCLREYAPEFRRQIEENAILPPQVTHSRIAAQKCTPELLGSMEANDRMAFVRKFPDILKKMDQEVPYTIQYLNVTADEIWINNERFSSGSNGFQKLGKRIGLNRTHIIREMLVHNKMSVHDFKRGFKKPIVHDLYIANEAMKVFQTLVPAFNESSFPLKAIYIDVDHDQDEVFTNYIGASHCKTLCLGLPGTPGWIGRWTDPLKALQHPNVMVTGSQKLAIDHWIQICADWIMSPRAVGHKFVVFLDNEDRFMKAAALIADRKNGVELIINRKVHFVIPSGTDDVVIHATHILHRMQGSMRCVVMEVQRRGALSENN